jgi:hypothetical protein
VTQGAAEAQNGGHGPASFVVYQARLRQPHQAAAGFQDGTAVGQDVVDPIGLGTIGQGDDVAAWSAKEVDGRAIDATTCARRGRSHVT